MHSIYEKKSEEIMTHIISDEMMKYIEILAQLELSEEEQVTVREDMEKLLQHIDKLQELDTSKVEPMSHIFPLKNVFREDVVTNGDGSESTLINAPARTDNGFLVPKTIG